MKKRVILSFCIAAMLAACVVNENKRTFYEGGALKSTVPVKHGRQNGTFQEYYENGKLKSEIEVSDDIRDGRGLVYYPSGDIAEECWYRDNIKVGEDKIFYRTGGLKNSITFDSLGNKADYVAFLENGEIDYSSMQPVATIKKSGQNHATLFLKLANADPGIYRTGRLVVTSKFTIHGEPVDTIYTETSTNIEGFEFEFDERLMMDTLRAALIFRIPRDTVVSEQIYALKYVPPKK